MGAMRRIRTILYTATIMLLSLTACNRESRDDAQRPVYAGERLPMSIRLAGVNAVNEDERITSVRVIVFTNQGELVSNDVTAVDAASSVTVTTLVARGSNNFYVFCNENSELADKLSGLTQESLIEELTFQASGVTPPLPMYGKVMNGLVTAKRDGTDVKVSVEGVVTSTLSVQVNRLLAKLNFTAIKNITDANADFTVEELRIKVYRMPKNTVMKEGQAYTSKVWAENVSLTGTGTLSTNGKYTISDKTYTVPAGVDKITFPDIYIPEHILSVPSDAEESTYLLIDASCRMKKGNPQLMHSIYMINIGENPPSNHNIKRNNHYDIYATIVGLGAMGIYAEIVSMDMHDIPINWKPVEGLVIVSDKISDYDFTNDVSKNVNVWNDYSVYSGILKVYHSDTGYKDVLFKYGSLIAVKNDLTASAPSPFAPPANATNLNDILWYPSSFGNPYGKITSWNQVPYVASGDVPVDNGRVAEALGDPCKLAGLSEEQIRDEGITDNKQWRMATAADYDILMRAADNESNAYGYKAFHQLLLPNVKSRDASGVLAADKNGAGDYWTANAAKAFGFTSATPAAAVMNVQNTSQGYTVRCIRTSIPVSDMAVSANPTISYQGNITTGAVFSIVSNIPYWTATLIEDPADPNIGTATEFADFSFAPGATNVKTASGKYSQSIPVYVKRKESTENRTFHLRVTGMGFDGKTESVIVIVTQNGYHFSAQIKSTMPEISRTTVLPQAGEKVTITIDVTPKDISVPAGTFRINANYNNKIIATSTTMPSEPDKYIYEGFEITIPPNDTPDIITLTFDIYLDNRQVSNGVNFSFMQNNK